MSDLNSTTPGSGSGVVDSRGLDDFLSGVTNDLPIASAGNLEKVSFPDHRVGAKQSHGVLSPAASQLEPTPAVKPAAPANFSALQASSATSVSSPLSLAEIEPQDVIDVLMLIPAADDGVRFVVDGQVMAVLRGEIQAWIALLREQGQMVTELLPLSVRDQSARKIASHLLDVAYKSPNQSWMTMLPTGKQVVIAPSHVFKTIGFEGVCRSVHQAAILAAKASGQPFNERAFSLYQAQNPAQVN